MNILCSITDLKERTSERGKTAGEVIKDQWVVFFDNWNVGIGLKKDGGTVSDMSYYGSIRHLLGCIDRKLPHIDKKSVAINILAALYEKTNKEPSIDMKQGIEEVGRDIDILYLTNFHKNKNVLKGIFPDVEDIIE